MLSDVYCQVALLRYQEAVAEGQHQQLVWGMWPAASPREVFTAIRQWLGAILVRVGTRLLARVQGVLPVASRDLSSVAGGEPVAIAS